jgi:DTW domain-containing protein YfiP
VPLSLVIVRHVLEANKVSNSGRLAAAVLPRVEQRCFGSQSQPLHEASLCGPNTWLLYPEGDALCAPPTPAPERLIVLDGTWPQARHMRQRIRALRGLPILSMPRPTTPFERLRRTPRTDQLPTAIAIAAALELLGEPDAAARLRQAWQDLIDACRIDGRLAKIDG